MTTSLQWLTDIAPTLATDTAKANRFLLIAKNEVCETLFSEADTYNLALAYYAAHLLQLSTQGGSSQGSLTMEKEGELERQYGNVSSSKGNGTQYLDSFNDLIKSRVPTFYIQDGSKSY
jgi:hypothetical protein